MTKVRVIRHLADDNKDFYRVEMEAENTDVGIEGSLVDLKLTLKAKTEIVLEKFPRGAVFDIKIEAA